MGEQARIGTSGEVAFSAGGRASLRRLDRPALPTTVVPRRRLAEALDAGVLRPVTLVCAGAGWGKSVLVEAWAEARVSSVPIGWLTLRPWHNDPQVFWGDFLGALDPGAVPRGDVLEQLRLGEGAGKDVARPLVAALRAIEAPTVVVLDDFHQVRDAEVIRGLAEMLRDPPPMLRLVLVGREEPPLPLHRLRAVGEVTEIRARDLAFQSAEAAELPAVRRQKMSPEELAGLLERTDGWVVGLQNVAGMAANREVRTVTDYLMDEVVAVRPGRIRRFLVRTSVAESVSGPLAAALTGESRSRNILERLVSTNAFVSEVEDRPGWFRYHPLLREALRHQLDVSRPGGEAELHVLAAQWYTRERLISDALRHAAAAQDWDLLGGVAVDRAMVRILTGDRRVFIDILRQVPPDRHAGSPELALCGAAVRYDDGDRTGVATMLRLAWSLVEKQDDTAVSTELTLRLMEAGIFLWWQGRMPELIEATSEVLKVLTAYRLDELPLLLHYRAVALDEKGAGLLWTDRADQADRYLWAAATTARRAGTTVVEVNALAHLGLLAYLQGSLGEAREFIDEALGLATGHDFDTSAQASMSFLARALIELEADQPAAAQESLRRGLYAGGDEPAAAPAVLATLIRARILATGGEPGAARTMVRQAREQKPESLVAPLLDRWMWLVESEADLALGESRAVVMRYESWPPSGVLGPSEQVCLARAHLDGGDHEAAERLLTRVRGGADRVAAVSAWIATAFAADGRGHGNRSIDAVSGALAAADRDGIRRPFRMLDPARLAVLLERRRWVEDHTTAAAEALAGLPDAPLGSAEVLSERERDVLRYLPTVLTAGEIAGNLHISVNTVKAHMRSIYRKLGAARRREAVVHARRLGLL